MFPPSNDLFISMQKNMLRGETNAKSLVHTQMQTGTHTLRIPNSEKRHRLVI